MADDTEAKYCQTSQNNKLGGGFDLNLAIYISDELDDLKRSLTKQGREFQSQQKGALSNLYGPLPRQTDRRSNALQKVTAELELVYKKRQEFKIDDNPHLHSLEFTVTKQGNQLFRLRYWSSIHVNSTATESYPVLPVYIDA